MIIGRSKNKFSQLVLVQRLRNTHTIIKQQIKELDGFDL